MRDENRKRERRVGSHYLSFVKLEGIEWNGVEGGKRMGVDRDEDDGGVTRSRHLLRCG